MRTDSTSEMSMALQHRVGNPRVAVGFMLRYCVCIVLSLQTAVFANPQAAGAAVPTRGLAAPRTVQWPELMPAGWAPASKVDGLDVSRLRDDDPRATELMEKLRASWDAAPVNSDLKGVSLRIAGYVVPLEDSAKGMTEFLLVPYFGACIHTPPPPANQIIHVRPQRPVKGLKTMDPVWVAGAMEVARSGTQHGVSGYFLRATGVEPFVRERRR